MAYWAADYDQELDVKEGRSDNNVQLVQDPPRGEVLELLQQQRQRKQRTEIGQVQPGGDSSKNLNFSEEEILEAELESMRLVWDETTEQRVTPHHPTSQILAYTQLVARQRQGIPIFVLIAAPAGYGKSFFASTF